MNNLHCRVCGSKTSARNQRSSICPDCGNISFNNPCPGTDVALFSDDGEVLISERANDPRKGSYNLPGGFTEAEETLEQGAHRELLEELALNTDDYTELQYVGSFCAKYPFSKQVYDVVVPVYTARIINPDRILSQDDSKSVRFVALEDLEDIDFSSDVYPEIIRTAHSKLFGG